MVINWIGRTFGFPEGFAGNLTSGGSASTILALATARDSKNVKAVDFSRCVVYMTQISHYCVEKALNTIGMREAVRRTVPTDKSTYKMNAEELKIIIEKDKNNDLIPFLVYATAGTTDLGSIDPLNEIASIARQHSLWMHVDACYGGFFIMSNEAKPSFRGIERCDSLAVDPHKSLFIPYGCGCVIVRQGSKLKYSNALNRPAPYAQDSFKDEREDEPSPCHLSFELSRHFRGVRVWMPLKLFGLAPFRDALTEKILLARYFYEQLAERDDFQLGPYPELSVVVFRYAKAPNDTEKFNEQLLDSLMRDGRVALASTRLRGVYYLRVCILCFRTHLKEVDLLLEMVDKNVEIYLKSVSKKPRESQQLS
ncbi:aromatic-L-amino-acid decarboxylase-like [Saccoglossus kowalevskii]|uniref:Probable tyrosine decarboxylase 2-like n=1 Tax=Saccoglossus kowalevskii TaxID=10224 RepID=A0ABM0GN05_SACKO|nr:PREDICTED: probable tyrosine decarboxylase 2-like [Saccoglossus kowalevskii]